MKHTHSEPPPLKVAFSLSVALQQKLLDASIETMELFDGMYRQIRRGEDGMPSLVSIKRVITLNALAIANARSELKQAGAEGRL